MNPVMRTLIIIFGILTTTPLWAATEVKDIETRPGVTQRLLILKPEHPVAVLVMFTGGDRPLNIADDGSLGWGGTSLLIRVGPLFVQNDFVVAIVDISSDQKISPGSHFRESAEHAQDIAAILAFLRKDSPLPVWLIGTGSGTTSVLNAAIRLQKDGGDGIVLTSALSAEAEDTFAPQLDKVRVPVLVIRKADPCNPAPQTSPGGIIALLRNSPKAEELTVSPSVEAGSNPCLAPSGHGYLGLENQLADKIATRIKSIMLPADFI